MHPSACSISTLLATLLLGCASVADDPSDDASTNPREAETVTVVVDSRSGAELAVLSWDAVPGEGTLSISGTATSITVTNEGEATIASDTIAALAVAAYERATDGGNALTHCGDPLLVCRPELDRWGCEYHCPPI